MSPPNPTSWRRPIRVAIERLLIGSLLVGCSSEPHRGPFDAEGTATHFESLNLSPEMVEALFRYDTSDQLVRLRLELRDGLLRVGDRIDVLAGEGSNEAIHCSLLVVGHDPDRAWATVKVRESRANLLVALPSPVHARLHDPHWDRDPSCDTPELELDDRIPPEARAKRRSGR